MKKFFCIISFLIFLSSGMVLGVYDDDAKDIPSFIGHVKDEFIVVVKEAASALVQKEGTPGNAFARISAFDALHKKFGVTHVKKQFPRVHRKASLLPTEKKLSRYYKVCFKKGSLEAAMAAYAKHPMVESVEPIGIHTTALIPNDPYYKDSPSPSFPYDQWHYWAVYGIAAEAAWDSETGSEQVVVGILDSGVRYFHKDLGGSWEGWESWDTDNPQNRGNIWINPAEIPGNGIDDDENGYVDDTIGWDFVDAKNNLFIRCIDQDCRNADNDPDDGNGHGTHVAGTVSAITNNNSMVAGIAGGFSDGTVTGTGNGVKIMPMRIGYHASYFGIPTGVVRMDWAAEAMDYIADQVDRGVNVAAINCSWGSSNSGGLGAAVDNLLAHDVVIVVAAGNSGSSTPDYLGSRGDCLDVAATDSTGYGPYWTNYGSWVDIAAPGVDIVSTYRNPDDTDPNHQYIAMMDGTSMAAPHVVGIAALLESYNSSLTGPQKFQYIVTNTNPYNNDGRDLGSGIANAKLALNAIGDAPPTVYIVDPLEGQTVSGIYLVLVSASDDSALSTVKLRIDGGSYIDITANFDGSYYFYDWDTTGYADGSHTAQARATDAAAQSTESASVNVVVDNVDNPPMVEVIDPVESQMVSGTYRVLVSATDDSALSTVELRIDGGSYIDITANFDGSYYFYDWDTTGYADGGHTAQACATDDATQSTESATVSVTVDNAPTSTMHVDSIEVSTINIGKGRKRGHVEVVILDDLQNPVSGAQVTGSFYEDISETSMSATTDTNGLAVLETTGSSKGRCHLTFCVDTVSHSVLYYAEGENVETCDSNY